MSYSAEINFTCIETQLSKCLDELQMNPEHLCPTAKIAQIEPSELSMLVDSEVSLDALNYLGKRMDGMDKREINEFPDILSSEGIEITLQSFSIPICSEISFPKK